MEPLCRPALLSEINDLGMGEIFRTEHKGSIRLVLGLEIGNVDSSPVSAIPHLHKRGHMGRAVYGDIQLLNRAIFVLRRQMHHMVGAGGGKRGIISGLVDVDEAIRIHGHLLCLRGMCDIHLICFSQIAPLRFAVVPDDGL